jgi:hypothetical protein
MSRRYSFVTVAFEGDSDLMMLQARSMALYCPRGLIDRIIIIDNFEGAPSLAWRDKLRRAYGRLGNLVIIVRAAKVTPKPLMHGWWYQQALKLAISSCVTSDRYVVLDAKTHLIAPLTLDFLEDEAGKARINRYPLKAHPLRPKLEAVYRWVGLDPQGALENGLVRTSTPFTMITGCARATAAMVERRENTVLAAAMGRTGVTEFFLYGALLEATGALDELYRFDQPWCQAIWPGTPRDPAALETALASALRPDGGPFFSVHRGALPLLDDAGRRALTEFWVGASLFDTAGAVESFLDR